MPPTTQVTPGTSPIIPPINAPFNPTGPMGSFPPTQSSQMAPLGAMGHTTSQPSQPVATGNVQSPPLFGSGVASNPQSMGGVAPPFQNVSANSSMPPNAETAGFNQSPAVSSTAPIPKRESTASGLDDILKVDSGKIGENILDINVFEKDKYATPDTKPVPNDSTSAGGNQASSGNPFSSNITIPGSDILGGQQQFSQQGMQNNLGQGLQSTFGNVGTQPPMSGVAQNGFNPNSFAQNGFNPNSAGQGGFNPNSGGQGGFNLNGAAQSGFNPNNGGQGGFNPNSGGQGSFNPNSGGQGGSNPNSGGQGGFNPNNSPAQGGFNPNGAPQGGFNPNGSTQNTFQGNPFASPTPTVLSQPQPVSGNPFDQNSSSNFDLNPFASPQQNMNNQQFIPNQFSNNAMQSNTMGSTGMGNVPMNSGSYTGMDGSMNPGVNNGNTGSVSGLR